MVVGTGVAVSVIAATGIPGVAGGAAGTVCAFGALALAGTQAAVTKAAGVATIGGAIASTVAAGKTIGAVAVTTGTGKAVGALAGAVAAGAATVGVGNSGLGMSSIVSGTGGVGLLLVGCDKRIQTGGVTFDCWKPVVHNTSPEPSAGILLKDLVSHPTVTSVVVTPGTLENLPNIRLQNVWNETFDIEYLVLDQAKLVCHATPNCD